MSPLVQQRWLHSNPSRHVACNALRKIGNNPQRSHILKEPNLEKLSSGDLTPSRQIGPVEVQQVPGHGRGVVATENLQPGSLLFISEPARAVLHGDAGQQLLPDQLSQHWLSSTAHLSATDRYKISLLSAVDTPASQLKSVSFRDFSSNKATSKAKKASAKGFAAAAAPKQQSSCQPAADLADDQLQQIVRSNAYGDDHVDAALAACRGEQQRSIIGVWPEFSLLNHSCAPNTVPPVLVSDRLLLRTAVIVPSGEQLTTSYLAAAGGLPAQQRQELLQKMYGFVCNCHRCQAESQAPPDISSTLQAMHECSLKYDLDHLLDLMQQDDRDTLSQIHHEASALVQQLEQQLKEVQDPLQVSWLRASAYNTYAVMLRVGEFLAGVKDVDSAQQLADMVRVFEPASESHLLLLSESAVRASEASRANISPQNPEQDQELRVRQLVRGLMLRYGEPRSSSSAYDLEVITQLAGSLTTAAGTHWLGVSDIGRSGRLDAVVSRIAAAGGGARAAVEAGKQKAELGLQQLGQMQ